MHTSPATCEFWVCPSSRRSKRIMQPRGGHWTRGRRMSSVKNWKTPHDIKRRYRSADFLADNRVIFDIKGNSYRLVVKVRYQNGLVVVEWVGTHAEYDKKKF
jgi:mRNA-degrading endonuclease HigB of HigAB toxin-antitoxin module